MRKHRLEALKSYIIKEAGLLFRQYGVKSVTMDDIAKHIGISKKTIYQHLRDKSELVNILLDAKLNTHKCELTRNAKLGMDAVHEVILGLADVNAWLTTFNGKVFYDLQKYFPRAWRKLKNFEEKSLTISIKNNLNRGIAENIYRKEINIEVIAGLRLRHAELIFGQHFNKHIYTTTEVATEITEHFLYGICNAKGIKLIEKYKQLTEEFKHKLS